MKSLLSLALLGMFSFAIIGCEASATVDPVDSTPSGTSTSVKKTTVQEPDGDRTVKTEVNTDR